MNTLTKAMLILIVAGCFSAVSAQDYKKLVALKYGTFKAVMYKQLLEDESAFAAQLAFKDKGVSVGGYRMFHQLALPKKNYRLFFYYGYGAHFRYYSEYKTNSPFKPWRPQSEYRGNYFAAGLDGVVGLEYRFLKYPFVASADFNPNFEFGGANFFSINVDQVSVGIAYTF